jgi:hypothetical protein
VVAGCATAGGVGFGGVCGGAADWADIETAVTVASAAAANVKRCKLNTRASWRAGAGGTIPEAREAG